MTYEAWRCTYQSSEQAARAAYEQAQELQRQNAALKLEAQNAKQLVEAVGAGGVERLRKCSGLHQIQEPCQLAAVQLGVQPAVPEHGEVLVTVSGFTGSGKSAIAGEIEIMCRALGLQVEWPDGVTEKNMTHADWTSELEMYNPRVRIIERNVPRNTISGSDQ